MDEIPFCKRNTRGWVALLVTTAVAVLGYSVWLASERGEFSGFAHNRNQARRAAARLAGPEPAVPAGPAQVMWPVPAGQQPGSPAPVAPAPVAPTPVAPAAAEPTPVALNVAPQTAPTPRRAAPAETTSALGLQDAFNRAADLIRPAVVNISAVRGPASAPQAGVAAGARFVDPFDGGSGPVGVADAHETVGSGIIVHPAGYVLTNYHVIVQAASVSVGYFREKNELHPAQVVASDRTADLALLQIAGASQLPAATFADSSKVEVGDWVMAVGNPFGLGHTVTAGIVGAKRSSLKIEGVLYPDLIQTDAPINRGSSGGPLVDLSGRVVGINTAIWAPTGAFSGAGFAIPSSRISAFLSQAFSAPGVGGLSRPGPSGASAATPYVGVGVSNLTPSSARAQLYPGSAGVVVESVSAGSPAAAAGIRRGDILTGLGRQPVRSQAELGALVSGLAPGTAVGVALWRGGRPVGLTLTVGAASAGNAGASGGVAPGMAFGP